MTSGAITGLPALVENTVFVGLALASKRVRTLAEQVRHGIDAPVRPFRILLAGGTGVGKSTLLNALAGRAIAPAGQRRPTTTGFTVYLHERDTDPWLHSLPGVSVVVHSQGGLEGKTLIDSPDADSAVTEHRAMLEEALAVADLVFVVVTEEKYLSSVVLGLMAAYREGREFALVFNKADRITDRGVVDDFRRTAASAGFEDAPLFTVSAQAAFQRGSSDPATGQFEELRAFIADGLDRARLAEIATSNLAERASAAGVAIRSALPPAWEGAADAWQQRCLLSIAARFADTATTLRRRLLREDELAAVITATRGCGFGGVFGWFSALAYALRGFFPPSARTLDAVDLSIRRRMEDISRGQDHSDELVREDFSAAAAELGVDPGAVRDLVTAHPAPATTAKLVAARLPGLVRREAERLSAPPGRVWNLVVNVPVWVWLGYWVFRTVTKVLEGLPPEWEAFPGAAIVGVIVLGLQWPVVHRIVMYSGRRRAKSVISSVLAQLESEATGLHAAAVDAVEGRIRQEIDVLRGELSLLDELSIGRACHGGEG